MLRLSRIKSPGDPPTVLQYPCITTFPRLVLFEEKIRKYTAVLVVPAEVLAHTREAFLLKTPATAVFIQALFPSQGMVQMRVPVFAAWQSAGFEPFPKMPRVGLMVVAVFPPKTVMLLRRAFRSPEDI